jgi:hypothetical protein
MTRPAPRANSQADVIAFSNPLADADGTKVGNLDVACITTKGARNVLRSRVTCEAVVPLRDGTLMVQVNAGPGDPTATGAVTGGNRAATR